MIDFEKLAAGIRIGLDRLGVPVVGVIVTQPALDPCFGWQVEATVTGEPYHIRGIIDTWAAYRSPNAMARTIQNTIESMARYYETVRPATWATLGYILR